MSREYKGLKIPDGLNKDNAREMYLTEDCAAAFYDYGNRPFCSGVCCRDCICVREHRNELKELLKLWEKEEDELIKPGMVVKYGPNAWCLVYRVASGNIYGWLVGDNTTEAGSKLCELGNYVSVPLSSIDKAYKFKADTMPHGEAIYSLTGNYTGWRGFWRDVELPVLELTVKDIEEKYGRKVKIVSGKVPSYWYRGKYFIPDVLTPGRLNIPVQDMCNMCSNEPCCTDCILYRKLGDPASLGNMAAFASLKYEWTKEEEKLKTNTLPELLPNTVIESVAGDHYLVTWAIEQTVYAYLLVVDPQKCDVIIDKDIYSKAFSPSTVLRVYGSSNIVNGVREPLRRSILTAIFKGSKQFLLWEKTDPVEMTMSDLKEKLGYDVKIVGEKND